MLDRVRAFVALIVLAFLSIGYVASVLAARQGPEAAMNYAESVDRPVMKWLSLLMLAASLAFFFMKPEEEQQT